MNTLLLAFACFGIISAYGFIYGRFLIKRGSYSDEAAGYTLMLFVGLSSLGLAILSLAALAEAFFNK